jgi:methionyl-tRNA formyltransferase
MRIGFAGTPQIAANVLSALTNSTIEISAVITMPDAAVGRSGELIPSPTAVVAEKLGIPIIKPPKLNDDNVIKFLDSLDLDVVIVVAYGKLIPDNLLKLAKLGWFNLHFSLLPAYRGAAPVQRAIMNGEQETGITIFQINSGLDSGPILTSSTVTIEPEDDAKTVFTKLTEIGIDLLVDSFHKLESKEYTLIDQDNSLATFAPKIYSTEARIDWKSSVREILQLIKGLAAGPVAFTELDGIRVKIHAAKLSGEDQIPVGKMLRIQDAIVVGTGNGNLELIEVQPAGKKIMLASQWFNGLRTENPWLQ